MTLEQQVCSLESAKRLKELGVKQESLFWWNVYASGGTYHPVIEVFKGFAGVDWAVSAFTVAEVGEMLPADHSDYEQKKSIKLHYKKDGGWYAVYKELVNEPMKYPAELYHHDEWSDTEAEARAKMLIYLLENKLV